VKTLEEKIIVCSCNKINYKEIKDAVEKFGTNYETLKEETTVGTVCEQCMMGDCDIVDLPLPFAVQRAKEELNL
jgi:bacterioferritin-associated ferredoxin